MKMNYDAEEERAIQIREFFKEEAISGGYYFELMDRCHVQMESIEMFILSNPHVQANKRMRKRIYKAQSLLMDVYQWAGIKDSDDPEGL